MRCDRRKYRRALEVRARGGTGICAHTFRDGCWWLAVGQPDDGRGPLRERRLKAKPRARDLTELRVIVAPHRVGRLADAEA